MLHSVSTSLNLGVLRRHGVRAAARVSTRAGEGAAAYALSRYVRGLLRAHQPARTTLSLVAIASAHSPAM